MGADVRIVYSIQDAVRIAKKTDRETVHFAIGFETTAPTTAVEILAGPPPNFSTYSAYLLIPPALIHLLHAGETPVDGFINPSHVSIIIGEISYRSVVEKYSVPQVIAGFEPLDVPFGIVKILKQIEEGRGEIENVYTRAVKPEGNPKAIRMMEKAFEEIDAPWRGIGIIPNSGLALKDKYRDHNANEHFDFKIEEEYEMPYGCRYGEILRALIYPRDCPLFNTDCTPETPIGPCMISMEASCYIAAKYGVYKNR